MKRTLKDRLMGVIIGIIIGATMITTAFAATGAIQKTLEYNNIKITLDGEEIIPNDANGKYVEPFAIEGTTYLPVRAISSALGLDVGWDGATNTVKLTTPENGTTTNESNTNNGEKIYSVGEKWIVDGQWEFTITSAKRHKLCNSVSNKNENYTNEDVILIEYSYKNIGYAGQLYISEGFDFDVYDSEGYALETYACVHTKSAQRCIKGTACSGASVACISTIKGDSVKIFIQMYAKYDDGKLTEESATFVIPIT